MCQPQGPHNRSGHQGHPGRARGGGALPGRRRPRPTMGSSAGRGSLRPVYFDRRWSAALLHPGRRGARRRKQRRARAGRSAGRTTGNHRALDRCLSGVTRPSRRGRPAHGVQALAGCQQRRRAGKRLQMLAYGKPRIHAARSRGLGSLRVHASRRSENTILSGGRLLLPFRNLDPT
jgi:hypothetical protein